MNVEKLARISKKPSRLVVGLMSGTSLDGLDIALCRFERESANLIQLLKFKTVEYDRDTKELIRSVFCKPEVNLETVCVLNAHLATLHAEMTLEALERWKVNAAEVDLIGSHGQTIYHRPAISEGHSGARPLPLLNATLQIGDGDHIAAKTGIITVSDFRQKHVALGGQGAPLAPYLDTVMFSSGEEDRVLLNIGGIANFTWLPRSRSSSVFSTDTGPGNTLIDIAVNEVFKLNQIGYDVGGLIASSGKVDQDLLGRLLKNEWFLKAWPKSTGQEVFNWKFVDDCLKGQRSDLSPADIVATLTKFTAVTVANAVKVNVRRDKRGGGNVEEEEPEGSVFIYVSGGGQHNKTMMQGIADELGGAGFVLRRLDDLKGSVTGDAKEAVLFAWLADQAVCGDRVGGVGFSMGKICFPN